VVYTHGIAGLLGGLLVGLLRDPNMIVYLGLGKNPSISGTGLFYGHPHQLLVQLEAALTIIIWDAVVTFVILMVIKHVFRMKLRLPDEVAGRSATWRCTARRPTRPTSWSAWDASMADAGVVGPADGKVPRRRPPDPRRRTLAPCFARDGARPVTPPARAPGAQPRTRRPQCPRKASSSHHDRAPT
jgi:hypothetical protein